MSRHVVRVLALGVAAASLTAEDSPLVAQATQTANLDVTATVKRNCTIRTDPINFGTYDALNALQVDEVGAIRITCTTGTPTTITLNNGDNAQAGQRAMAGGTPTGLLHYELFLNSTRSVRWGDAGEEIFAPPAAPSNQERSFTVYGRILAGQTNVSVGDYRDTVLAVVNF